jgi:hypothetical protein
MDEINRILERNYRAAVNARYQEQLAIRLAQTKIVDTIDDRNAIVARLSAPQFQIPDPDINVNLQTRYRGILTRLDEDHMNSHIELRLPVTILSELRSQNNIERKYIKFRTPIRPHWYNIEVYVSDLLITELNQGLGLYIGGNNVVDGYLADTATNVNGTGDETSACARIRNSIPYDIKMTRNAVNGYFPIHTSKEQLRNIATKNGMYVVAFYNGRVGNYKDFSIKRIIIRITSTKNVPSIAKRTIIGDAEIIVTTIDINHAAVAK